MTVETSPVSHPPAAYETLVHESPVAMAVLTPDGHFLEHNRALATLLGYENEGLAGRPVTAVLGRRELARVARCVRTDGRFEGDVVYFDQRRQQKTVGLIVIGFGKPEIDTNPLAAGFVAIHSQSAAGTDHEAELERSVSLLGATLEATTDGIVVVDLAGRVVQHNRRFVEMWDVPSEVISSERHSDLVDFAAAQLENGSDFEAWVDGLIAEREERGRRTLRLTDGRVIDCATNPQMLGDVIVGRLWSCRDVTGQVTAAETVRASQRYYRSLIENALDIMAVVDEAGVIRFGSPSLEAVLGVSPSELKGRPSIDLIHPHDVESVIATARRGQGEPGHTARAEVRVRHHDGEWRTLDIIGRNLLEDPSVQGVVVNARDVTEKKVEEARLIHDAFHDQLTGLPNRALVLDRINQLLKRASRKDDPGFAVLFLDLDRFKRVNDSLGHMMGDQLLSAIADRLESQVRAADTIARLAGDEFTVLLDFAGELSDAGVVAERIQSALEEGFVLGGHEVYVTVSIGIATSRAGYKDAEEILRDADLAMYRAKELGRSRHEVFDQQMHAQAVAYLELETGLRRALERNELRLFYQPIVDLETQDLVSFEALLRWKHPERGLLFPADFLTAAEETGLIIPIGWWVFDEACRQICAWRELMGDEMCIPVQVNLSGRQLEQRDLVDRMDALIDKWSIPEGCLNVELTEGSMMDSAEATIEALTRLKALGIKISIDDFGTGYSSLSYLHRFPTHRVKIDRTFISRLGPNGENATIVQTILDIARDQGMDVVAEGVETAEQLAGLRALNCEYGQGFYFAGAIPGVEATELLKKKLSHR